MMDGPRRKAYICRDEGSCEDYVTVVFAEKPSKAKAVALGSPMFEGATYMDIWVRRCKDLDDCYRGHAEMDWNDTLDRIDLVSKCGFYCVDVDRSECPECCAKDYCGNYQDYLAELEYLKKETPDHD